MKIKVYITKYLTVANSAAILPAPFEKAIATTVPCEISVPLLGGGTSSKQNEISVT